MTRRVREFVFSGAALAIVCGAIGLSGAISKEEVAALTHRALDLAFISGVVPLVPETDTAAALPQGETAMPAPPVLRVSAPRPVRIDTGMDLRLACGDHPASPSVIGDRLKLRIYETQATELALDGTEIAAGSVAFERLDLTGVYEIGADGSLSLPLVGRVPASGRDLGCLEATLGNELSKAFGSPLRISAAYESRPVIVLLGDVRAPGRYDASPGLSVQDLLGVAGDPLRYSPDIRYLASLDARRSELETALADRRIETARLRALLDGKDYLGLTQAAYNTLEEKLGSDRLALEALALNAQNEETREDRSRALRDIEALSREVQEREAHLKIVSDQLAILDERHEELKTLQSRGVVTALVVSQSDMDRMAMQRTLIEARMGLIQARSAHDRLLSAESYRAAQRHSDLTMRLLAVAKESTALASQLDGIETQIGSESSNDTRRDSLTVRIERRDPKGNAIIEADMQSELLPGDLVTIHVGAEAQYAQNKASAKPFSIAMEPTGQ